MGRHQIAHFISAIGGPVPHSGGDWITTPCPFALWRHSNGVDSNPSFGIDSATGKAHCFSCGFSGDMQDIVMELATLSPGAFDVGKAMAIVSGFVPDEKPFGFTEEVISKVRPWKPDFVSQHFPRLDMMPDAVAYMESRGFDPEFCMSLGMVFDPVHRRVCFPLRDFKNRLVGLHGRAIDQGATPKYWSYEGPFEFGGGWGRNPDCWFGEQWVKTTETVVVVESVFDAANVLQVYPNVIAPLSATPSKSKLKRMDLLDWVRIIPDSDAAGQKLVASIKKAWETTSISVVQIVSSDPGSAPLKEIFQALDGLIDKA